MTGKRLVQSPEKFLCGIWNLSIKTYQNFVTLRSIFKIFKKKFKNVKKNEKIQMDSKKSLNSFTIKKG